jgi:2-phosphosulfolactate phosphatase
MEIKRATLATCGAATGAVVVIDVIRAFTTAAYAFAAGAREILLVSTVEEALALRERMPGALVMGEVNGLPVTGFDLDNSPAALIACDLAGRRLIQRTSHGTQGAVRSHQAETLLAASLVCASATARYIRSLAPASVTFVITGDTTDRDGDEDAACADYIAALLQGERPDPLPFLQRVRAAAAARHLAELPRPELSAADLACCLAVDRFDFVLQVQRREGLLVMEPVTPPSLLAPRNSPNEQITGQPGSGKIPSGSSSTGCRPARRAPTTSA